MSPSRKHLIRRYVEMVAAKYMHHGGHGHAGVRGAEDPVAA
jgi:hypothetical protein